MKSLKEFDGTLDEYCTEYNIKSLKELVKLSEKKYPREYTEKQKTHKRRPRIKKHRLVKKGFRRNGKQIYAIKDGNNKTIKTSINLTKLFAHTCDNLLK